MIIEQQLDVFDGATLEYDRPTSVGGYALIVHGVRIDFVVAGEYPGDGKEKPVAFPRPGDVSEDRQGIRVVTLEALIELKLASGMTASGRLQDLADVQRLIQEHHLSPDYAARLNPYVQPKFRELAAS